MRAKEPIRGTALPDVDVWLLLEHHGRWEADVAETELAPNVAGWLDDLCAKIPRSRKLLVRRDRPGRHLNFFVVKTGADGGVFRFQGADHGSFSSLDVADVVSRGVPAAEAQGGERARPLYVVCTHGRRDACCARKGVAFYRALEAIDHGAEVWQSSHQGGHRFAATMLYLPNGAQYGRLEPSDAMPMVEAHARGRIFDLSKFRGSTSRSVPLQSAEGWLRDALDERRLLAIEHIEDGELDDDRYFARLRVGGSTTHTLVLAEREGKERRLASCAAEGPTPFAYYDVVRHEAHT